MAGKNAKRKAKAIKAGSRFLEMPKDLWRKIASVTAMAGAMGASASVAERCRVLAARANYYLGEPENRHGLVRGELTREEWTAYCDLVKELGDESTEVKALAHAMEILGEDQELSMTQMVNIDDLDEQTRQDAALVCQPEALLAIIAILELSIAYAERSYRIASQAGRSGTMRKSVPNVPTEELHKGMIDSAKSSQVKLRAIIDTVSKTAGTARIAFPFTPMEAKTVYSLLRTFQQNMLSGAETLPEHLRGKEEIADLLKSAVRFFARLAGAGDDALKEIQ